MVFGKVIVIAARSMQIIIATVLDKELLWVLKGYNTARYLFTAMAARVKVDMLTDTVILVVVILHIASPRNLQRPKNLEDAKTLMMMSETERLRR